MLRSQIVITTSEHDGNRKVLYHRLAGSISLAEAQRAVQETQVLVARAIQKYGQFDLVLDVRGYSFEGLEARRTWSLGVKEHPDLAASVVNVAVIGDDNDVFREEKATMETESLRFFSDEAAAKQWLGIVSEP